MKKIMINFDIKKVIAGCGCILLVAFMRNGCRTKSVSEKTIVRIFYSETFEHIEQLVEFTYSDIDLRVERTPYRNEQLRRLEKEAGPDLVVLNQPSSINLQMSLLDINDTSASTAYEGTIDGVQWLADFESKKSTFSGVWEKGFALGEHMADVGVLDPMAMGKQRKLIRYLERMVNGSQEVVFGTSSLFYQCVEENKIAAENGAAAYSYQILPIFSDEGRITNLAGMNR